MTTALATLLERAEAERDLVHTALRRADDQLDRQRAQALQLADYRRDYQQRWSAQFARGGAPEIIQCYRSFMTRLDEALSQQQAQVDMASAQSERLRGQLVAAEMRVASVRKLIERRQAEHRRVQAQHDQRQADDYAQRARTPVGNTQAMPL